MSEKKMRKKVLIVDDEIGQLTTLQFIFEDNGFDVTMVSGGKEALQKIKEDNYDMVLLDINMPEIDGLQTFRQIKKQTPSTAVFMMTGNRESARVKKCIEEGAVTVFYKPFSVNNILEVIDKIMKRPVVLIVDDRSDDRLIMRNALELHNYRIVEASDGIDAIHKVKKGNFDICLVDYKMPGMNGLETVEKIKEQRSDIDVIMISGYTLGEAIKRELQNEKGVTLLKKPFEINNLVDIIKEDRET